MNLIATYFTRDSKTIHISKTVLLVFGGVLIFTQYFGLVSLADELALDMRMFYGYEAFTSILDQLTKSDRIAYLWIHGADYLFILGFYPLIYTFLQRLTRPYPKWQFLTILPLLAMANDLLENLSMDVHLWIYPRQITVIAWLSGWFSTIKFLSLYSAIAAIVVLLVYRKIAKHQEE